jgi:hypothetical protein
MTKKIKFYCYECDQEWTITTDSKEDLKYCPFCGIALETADKDIEEDD